MSFRDENGKHRVPKEIEPPPRSDQIKRADYWKNKTLSKAHREKMFFDQDVRTGECYFCKRMGDAQKSRETYLHHATYLDYDTEPLRWTIEVCNSCHVRVDDRLRKKIDVEGFKVRRKREQEERRAKEPMFFNVGGKQIPLTVEDYKRLGIKPR